jgi:hypothetical protein
MSTPTPHDIRIDTLTAEVDRLRKSRHLADNQLQQMLLKIAEIQLNLATQDATLEKLELSVHGNGKPGLATRVDRIERTTTNLLKFVWILIAALATATADITFHLRHP